MPRCGYVKIDNEVFTKHDVTMSGRRNACKVMENFPPCIHTGDGASFDMKLSNKVRAFNINMLQIGRYEEYCFIKILFLICLKIIAIGLQYVESIFEI